MSQIYLYPLNPASQGSSSLAICLLANLYLSRLFTCFLDGGWKTSAVCLKPQEIAIGGEKDLGFLDYIWGYHPNEVSDPQHISLWPKAMHQLFLVLSTVMPGQVRALRKPDHISTERRQEPPLALNHQLQLGQFSLSEATSTLTSHHDLQSSVLFVSV